MSPAHGAGVITRSLPDMPRAHEPAEGEVPNSERARIKHRDRKRETRMVVDNAGVRRLLPAVERRRQSGEKKAE